MYFKERDMIVYICVSLCVRVCVKHRFCAHPKAELASLPIYIWFSFIHKQAKRTPTLLIPGCSFSPKRKKRGRYERKLKCKASCPNHSLFFHRLSPKVITQTPVQGSKWKMRNSIGKISEPNSVPENPNFQ